MSIRQKKNKVTQTLTIPIFARILYLCTKTEFSLKHLKLLKITTGKKAKKRIIELY